jgi:tight adherence protein B
MVLAFLVFIVVVGVVFGAYYATTVLPGVLEQRKLSQRLQDVSAPLDKAEDVSAASVLAKVSDGPLPGVDRLVAGTSAGSWLARQIEQAGLKATPSAVLVVTLAAAAFGGVAAEVFTRYRAATPVAAVICGCVPIAFIVQRRGARMRKFEEQFPEALDLLSRALRAGHAFQSTLGMVGDELPDPVGPEFKKTFEQQNFGLPLKEALHQMTERVPLLDMRFFVTAVLIQRETGGNLSEILDNLAHVVRERFKIRRQVRVHTAHGRFTAFVLLSLPAALAVTLWTINPDHMRVLFEEQLGQMMLVTVIIMQTIGFFWIRKVIKIEV